jgi:two-component system sensor histidine kinase BaeS
MKLSIAHKLFAFAFAIALSAVAAMVAATRVGMESGFSAYVSAEELRRLDVPTSALLSVYAYDGSWERVRQAGDLRPFMPRQGPPPPAGGGGPGRGPPGGPPADRDPANVMGRAALLDAEGVLVAGNPAAPSGLRRELVFNDVTVGYLALVPQDGLTDAADIAFFESQMRMLYAIGAAALALSALAGWLMARHFRAPIRALAEAAGRMAGGDYAVRIDTARGDELGELAGDFNRLGDALERHESSRRRFVADASHELRTPLAVLRAGVEALQDGVHEPSPKVLGGLHDNVMRLNRLVDELYELARADLGQATYSPERTDPREILDDALDRFAPRFAERKLDVVRDLARAQRASVLADPDRLRQVFDNLLENTLRYTDEGGRVRAGAKLAGGLLILTLEDSSPGVPDGQMERIFERFHRVDASRSRKAGGSGLGLSIAKSIIEAHEGSIAASPSELGGLKLTMSFKLAEGKGNG